MTADQYGSERSPLADACPSCPPGDHPAVLPSAVTTEGGSLRASYAHAPCGTRWDCWWDREAAGWPLRREAAAGPGQVPAPPAVPAQREIAPTLWGLS